MAAITSIFANRIKPARLNPNPALRLPITHIIRCAHVDNAILYHDKLLANLYALEKRYQTNQQKIFQQVQSDIQPWMRKMVISWLLEVCEEIQMEQEVYFTAVNITDRVLSELYVKRDHFQLVGTAALMIASKLKETLPITPDRMVLYTDNSVSFEDLIQMEQIILTQLIWDVSCPTVIDFVDILCQRSAQTFGSDKRMLTRIKQLAQHISQKAVIEHQFIDYSPSTIAAACVVIATTELLPPMPVHATSLPILNKKHQGLGASVAASPDKSSGYGTSCENSSTDVSPANLHVAQRLHQSSAPYNYHPQVGFPVPTHYNYQRGNAPSNPIHAHSVGAFPSSRSNSDSSLASGEAEQGQNDHVSRQHYDSGHYRTVSCSSAASSSSVSSRSENASTAIKLKVQYRQRTLAASILDMRKAAGSELRDLIPAVQLIGELRVWKIPTEDLSHLLPDLAYPLPTIPPPPKKRQSLACPEQIAQPQRISPSKPHRKSVAIAHYSNPKKSQTSSVSMSSSSTSKTTTICDTGQSRSDGAEFSSIYDRQAQPCTPTSSHDNSGRSSHSSLAGFEPAFQKEFGAHLGPHSVLPNDDIENIESILSGLFPDETSRSDMLI